MHDIRPFPTLATPTTVSPTSATNQEHHQQNDQYSFHNIVPHFQEEAGLAFVTAISFLHYPHAISGEDVCLSRLDHVESLD